jgi:hypothetical protein
MQRKNIDLMAPVGSYESLMAAIQGGADAVYFGICVYLLGRRITARRKQDDLCVIFPCGFIWVYYDSINDYDLIGC